MKKTFIRLITALIFASCFISCVYKASVPDNEFTGKVFISGDGVKTVFTSNTITVSYEDDKGNYNPNRKYTYTIDEENKILKVRPYSVFTETGKELKKAKDCTEYVMARINKNIEETEDSIEFNDYKEISTELWNLYFSQTSKVKYEIDERNNLYTEFIMEELSDITVLSLFDASSDSDTFYISTNSMSYILLNSTAGDDLYFDFVFNPKKTEFQLYEFFPGESPENIGGLNIITPDFDKKITGATANFKFSLETDSEDNQYLLFTVVSIPDSYEYIDKEGETQKITGLKEFEGDYKLNISTAVLFNGTLEETE